jgi:protein phosphatase
MKLAAYSVTDIGRIRKINQDYVFTSEVPIGALPNLFIVADGMGGHKAGEYASKHTVETIVGETNLSTERNAVRVISKAVRVANRKIRKKALSDDNYFGMGTTLVVATIDDNGLTVANVGDSRLYILSDRLRQVTVDHSLVEEMVRAGTLERKYARIHPERNVITRAIGVEDDVKVDFFRIPLPDCRLILLCSDGLTTMLEDDEIERVLQMDASLEEKVETLVADANRAGGKDNISVVLIDTSPDRG